jgi:hypothetical protein
MIIKSPAKRTLTSLRVLGILASMIRGGQIATTSHPRVWVGGGQHIAHRGRSG